MQEVWEQFSFVFPLSFPFVISFVCNFLRAFYYILLGQAWAQDKGELQRATRRLIEAGVRWWTSVHTLHTCVYRHNLDRSHAITD